MSVPLFRIIVSVPLFPCPAFSDAGRRPGLEPGADPGPIAAKARRSGLIGPGSAACLRRPFARDDNPKQPLRHLHSVWRAQPRAPRLNTTILVIPAGLPAQADCRAGTALVADLQVPDLRLAFVGPPSGMTHCAAHAPERPAANTSHPPGDPKLRYGRKTS